MKITSATPTPRNQQNTRAITQPKALRFASDDKHNPQPHSDKPAAQNPFKAYVWAGLKEVYEKKILILVSMATLGAFCLLNPATLVGLPIALAIAFVSSSSVAFIMGLIKHRNQLSH